MLHSLRALSATLLVGAALSACTTVGGGSGIDESTHASVRFLWQSDDPTHGSISATLPEGRKYVGSYKQIPIPGDLGDRVRVRQGEDHYTDRVEAQLQAENGESMSCVFHLANSNGGMGEGGKGECNVGTNTIDVVLPRSLPSGV